MSTHREQVTVGKESFWIETDDFQKLVKIVSHYKEMDYRTRQLAPKDADGPFGHFQFRQNEGNDFYEMVHFVSSRGDEKGYRMRLRMSAYKEKNRPLEELSLFINSDSRWERYVKDGDTGYTEFYDPAAGLWKKGEYDSKKMIWIEKP